MVRLVMILLGVDYLRTRWRTLQLIGWVSLLLGVVVFVDALDNALYFPITPFALLLLLEGLATLAVAWTGMGGQRTLRYVKGFAFCCAAALILAGHHHGNFILSMIFGTLFLADGLLQIVSARVVRYRTWRFAMIGGGVEIALAVFFLPAVPDALCRHRAVLSGPRSDLRRLEHDSAEYAGSADGVESGGGRRGSGGWR